MMREFTLTDSRARADLQVFLGRAGRLDDGSVKLVGVGRVLAVYVAVLTPSGLLDRTPTVLGLRTFELTHDVDFDLVVPVRALLDRLARHEATEVTNAAPVTVSIPLESSIAAWAAISAPRGGWLSIDETSDSLLDVTARSGIDEVATAVPTGTGEQIVHRVRSEVWGRPIEQLENVPAGGAFAAFSLGFLGAGVPVRVFESGSWTRLTTPRGHVLVKQRF